MADSTLTPDPLLYTPHSPEQSRVFQFLKRINAKYSLANSSYSDLYEWSIANIDEFWSEVWDETDVIGEKGKHVVDVSALPPANPAWFSEAKLNYAENMLRCRSPDKIALIEATEPSTNDPQPTFRRVTYAELYEVVADIASALLSYGLKPGDRVASYSSNCVVWSPSSEDPLLDSNLIDSASQENVAACLASTAIGCIWVSAAADFGAEGVLERFEQVQPKLIFSVEAVVYNAKVHLHLPKLRSLLKGIADRVDQQPSVIVVPHPSSNGLRNEWDGAWTSWDDFVHVGRAKKLGRTAEGEIEWARLGFDWPLWILFSSGTTGRPKPIVHRAGGMLLQSKKEFVICADLKPEDVFFYYTTTGWMMWNFLVNSLTIGCTLVLYDGSPLRDPAYLWNLVDELGITIFGTSAKYIDQLSKVYKPAEHHSLLTLRHIYSTGSPLAPASFDFVYKHIRGDVLLASITGGTDICSLFAVETFTPDRTIAGPDEAGELVCLKPFPCMPLGFWPLSGFGAQDAVAAAAVRYQQAYFSEFEGVWYHGDHVIITRSRAGNGGGLIMLGRSDGVLNPGGIRFGSAELYDVIELCFAPSNTHATHTIVDCLAVGQSIAQGSDERVILFVKLLEGQTLTGELEKKIKSEIRSRRSARHVPARIIQVDDIPYTVNLKRVEVPVKKIINGAPVSSVNPSTLKNPQCLTAYEATGRMLRAEVDV